jgi:predicted ATPase
MLRRVHIRGYKSLRDVEVRLTPLSVLFGPNAAGKSNFLDALQLLSRIATRKTLKDAFEPPHRGWPLESFTFGPLGVAGLLKQASSSFSIEVDVELTPATIATAEKHIRELRKKAPPDGEDGQGDRVAEGDPELSRGPRVREHLLRYRIKVEILPQSGVLRVADEHLVALNTQGQPSERRKPFIELMPDGYIHLRMEGQARPTHHEKGLDYSLLSQPLYPPHYPHITALREELARWLFFYFEPRERMRAPSPVREVRHVGSMGEDLAAYLNTLRAAAPRQLEAMERALKAIVPSVTGIKVEPNSLGEVEIQVLEGGIPVSSRLLSEGTLRILGLLSMKGVKDSPALIAIEEPENGVQPRRIQLIARLLQNLAEDGDVQLIATTHSPILPDLIPNESLLVCRRNKTGTEIRPFREAWGPLSRSEDIRTGLDGEEAGHIQRRILRGDFDA